jgi:protocatechuate 3,4-dioxygenase beta subunit
VVVHLFKDGVDTNKTAITDNNGQYVFQNLVPGTYHVKFDKPVDYKFSPKDQ